MNRLTSALVLTIAVSLLATGCTAPIAPATPLPATPFQSMSADLVVGTPVSYDLTAKDWPRWLGEPYDSDYCTACRGYWLATPETNDVRVELVWSGSKALQMWAGETPAVFDASSGAAVLVVRGGARTLITVGTPYPAGAPTTAIHFTLSATAISPAAR